MAREKVNTGYLSNLVSDYQAKIRDNMGIVDIVTFAEAPWGLKFPILPMQRLILKVFYGLPLDGFDKNIPLPDDLNSKILGNFTEQEMMDYLIANRRINLKSYEPGRTRPELMLCCGRRGSKSSMISIIGCYESYRMLKLSNPQAYYGFPSGQKISITTVASSKEQASTLFDMMKTKISESSFFQGKIEKCTSEEITLRTDDDMRVGREASVEVFCGGAESSILRSKNNLVVIVDEAAYFDRFGRASLKNVWDALTPSIATFVPKGKSTDENEGKKIMLSSPRSKSGMFWEEYCESFDNPDDILMFQMYSSMINTRIASSELRSAYRKDRSMFRCEYGGEFSDTVEGWCDPDALSKSIDRTVVGNRFKGESGISYYMGIDFGGKNDGTSLAIVHREDETIVLDYADVFYGVGSDVWESGVAHYREVNRKFASEEILPLAGIADEVKSLCDRFSVVEGWFDQFNGYGLLELLKERTLTQFSTKNVNASLNLQVYQTVKSLLNSGLLRLFNHPVLIPELATLEERRNGATALVEAPQRSGFHDDISDAFARAVYCAYNSKRSATKKVTLGLGRGGVSTMMTYKAFQMDRFRKHSGYNGGIL